MDWYKLLNDRKNAIKPIKEKIHQLEKQEKKLQKDVKAVGTVDICELLCELIEYTYGNKARIKYFRTGNSRLIEIYDKNATKKQVQYGRPECIIGWIQIAEEDGKYYIDETIKDSPTYYIPLPHELDEVYRYAIYRSK